MTFIKKIIEKIKTWSNEKIKYPDDYDPNGPIAISGHIERPLLSRALRAIVIFWFNNWKWIIGTIIGLIVAYFTIRKN